MSEELNAANHPPSSQHAMEKQQVLQNAVRSPSLGKECDAGVQRPFRMKPQKIAVLCYENAAIPRSLRQMFLVGRGDQAGVSGSGHVDPSAAQSSNNELADMFVDVKTDRFVQEICFIRASLAWRRDSAPDCAAATAAASSRSS